MEDRDIAQRREQLAQEAIGIVVLDEVWPIIGAVRKAAQDNGAVRLVDLLDRMNDLAREHAESVQADLVAFEQDQRAATLTPHEQAESARLLGEALGIPEQEARQVVEDMGTGLYL